MPVMGFDDERVRDEFERASDEARREYVEKVLRMGDAELRVMLQKREQPPEVFVELAKALEGLGEVLLAELEKLLMPVLDAMLKLGEAVSGAVMEWWGKWTEWTGVDGVDTLDAVDKADGWGGRRPAHQNCRCMPVERVDPVRAGRSRWWTRK